MAVFARLAMAVLAIVLGNRMIPDGTTLDALSADSSDFDLFIGTILIIMGAVVFARTAVAYVKSRFPSDK